MGNVGGGGGRQRERFIGVHNSRIRRGKNAALKPSKKREPLMVAMINKEGGRQHRRLTKTNA